MQCRECGATIAANVSFCPTCGARQAVAAPTASPAAPVAVAIPSPSPSKPPAPAAPIVKPSAPAPAVNAPGMAVASPSKSALPHMGETFANRYRVEKYLGLGALCNTYLCRDLASGNQEMVLKIMHARKTAEAGMADSFIFLAQSVAKYDHRGIARIFDAGRHNGMPYYTMEWVGGVPLRLWLMERLNFENRVLPGLGILASLLDTFEAIHERGCYGCVKPENVFVTLNGPVIMDFGVVGFLSPQEFEFNSYARRYLPYMAPELRQDWSNLLPHSDFFSLGAILYEILVGRVPAPQLRLPSELSRVFGIEADEIILKAMAARPLDRFATVEAFKQAVISLQATLLNARPQDAAHAAVLPGAATPQAHPGLERTSDPVSIHNPDEAFEDPGTGTLRTPGTGTLPIQSEDPVRTAPGWPRAGAPADPLRSLDRDPAEAGEGARTVFYPKPGEESPEAAEHTLSSFAEMGDRKLEEAHSQRRFAHGPGPLAAVIADPSAPAADWRDADGAATGLEDPLPGDDAPPVPAWLWVSIALAGSCMVVLSAYFGLLRGH